VFTHAGVRCAVPADKAQRASASSEAVAAAQPLWDLAPVASDDATQQRALLIETPEGPRTVGASSVSLVELDAATVWPQPALLRRLLRRPEVVGVALHAGELTWLVDPERREP